MNSNNNHPPKKTPAQKANKEQDDKVENSNLPIEEKGKSKTYTSAEKKPKKKPIF